MNEECRQLREQLKTVEARQGQQGLDIGNWLTAEAEHGAERSERRAVQAEEKATAAVVAAEAAAALEAVRPVMQTNPAQGGTGGSRDWHSPQMRARSREAIGDYAGAGRIKADQLLELNDAMNFNHYNY